MADATLPDTPQGVDTAPGAELAGGPGGDAVRASDAERDAPATARPFAAAFPDWRALLPTVLLDPVDLPRPRPSGTPLADPDAAPAGRPHAWLGLAHEELALPWATLPATLLARMHRDGNRDAYERVVFERQDRLTRAALAALVVGDGGGDGPNGDPFLDAVADGVLLLAEQSTWCWPAHDDARARRGWVLPDPDAPYLDLGAGEVAAQLAWIDALLADRLDARWPGLRERIRREVDARVLTPFLDRRDWHWIGLDGDVHNWNPWIHGNVLAAALHLLDADDPRRLRVVELCIEGLDRYLAVLPADGAIDEGYGYWWNGACRAIEALDLLRGATGGALDAAALPVLRATATFPRRCHLGGDWFLNVADGQARPDHVMPWHALFRAAHWLGDPPSASFALDRRDAAGGEPLVVSSGLGRCLRALADEEWCTATPPSADEAGSPSGAPHRTSSWWPSVEVLSLPPASESGRADGRPGGLGLTVKGGHNGEHHNHLDVGEVIVDAAGVPVVVDVGRPTYTAGTFGPDRYDEWCLTSPWHSVPTIAGTVQGVGVEHTARDVELVGGSDHDGDDVSGLSLELTGAYPGVDGTWRRTATVEPDGSVRVLDAWDLRGPAGTSDVHHVLAGDVTRGDGWVDVTPVGGGAPVRLTWRSDAPVTVSLTSHELTDPMHRDVWGERLTRLTLATAAPRGWIETVATRPDDIATPRPPSGMMPTTPDSPPSSITPATSATTPQEHP